MSRFGTTRTTRHDMLCWDDTTHFRRRRYAFAVPPDSCCHFPTHSHRPHDDGFRPIYVPELRSHDALSRPCPCYQPVSLPHSMYTTFPHASSSPCTSSFCTTARPSRPSRKSTRFPARDTTVSSRKTKPRLTRPSRPRTPLRSARGKWREYVDRWAVDIPDHSLSAPCTPSPTPHPTLDNLLLAFLLLVDLYLLFLCAVGADWEVLVK